MYVLIYIWLQKGYFFSLKMPPSAYNETQTKTYIRNLRYASVNMIRNNICIQDFKHEGGLVSEIYTFIMFMKKVCFLIPNTVT